MELTIHCPGCGTEASLKQRFCRTCGFSLEKVPQLVAEQLSESEAILDSNAAKKLQKRQQKIERGLSVAGIGFIALVALSMLVGLIYLMLVGSLPMVPGTILVTLVLVGLVAGSLGIYSENLKKKLSGNISLKSGLLTEREIASRPAIEDFEVPFRSVTEGTTKLLNNEEGVETKK